MEETDFKAVLNRYRSGLRGAPEVVCGNCNDTGFELLEGCAMPCEFCRDVKSDLKTAGIPEEFRDATLEGVEKGLQGVAKRLRGIATGSGRGAILRGGVGQGKSHLMAATCRFMAERGQTILWVKAARVLEQLERARSEEGLSEAAVLNPMRAADVLAIDDLGAHRVSEAVVHRLEDLLDDRVVGYEDTDYKPEGWSRRSVIKGRKMDRRKMLLITTNYTRHEIEQKFRMRFASRIKMLEWITLDPKVPDLREA